MCDGPINALCSTTSTDCGYRSELSSLYSLTTHYPLYTLVTGRHTSLPPHQTHPHAASASKLSNNFCQLQSGLNVAEGKPSHYDLYSNPHHRVSGGSLVRTNSRDTALLYSGSWLLFCASAECMKHHFLVHVMLLSMTSSLFLFFSLQEGLVPGFK